MRTVENITEDSINEDLQIVNTGAAKASNAASHSDMSPITRDSNRPPGMKDE